MRELTYDELDNVSGGALPLAILAGAALNGFISAINNGSKTDIAAAIALGGLTGGSSTIARTATGLIKYKWRAQTAGLTVASGSASAQGSEAKIDSSEIELDESN